MNQQALAAVPSAPAPVDEGQAVTLESLAAEVAALRARVEHLEARAPAGPAEIAAPTAAPAQVDAVQAPAATGETAANPSLGARPHDPQAEIHALLQVMFTLALHANPEDPDPAVVERDFEQFRALVHHTRKGSPLLNQELFHYKWKPLCKRVKGYLANEADPTTFKVTSTQPDRIDARTESVRVFVRADKRMPPPVLLRRDPDAGNAFRIDQSSL